METKTILREEFEKSTGKKPTNVAGRLTDKYAKWLEKHTSVHSLVSLSIPVPEERDDRAQRPTSDEMKSACRKFWSEANIESPALTKSAAFELGFIEGYGFCEEFSAQENKDLLHQLGNCESAYKQEKKLRESFEKALEERDQENKDLVAENERLQKDLEDSVHTSVCNEFMEKAINLRAALVEAKSLIKSFHGPDCWDIYDTMSPEMKRLNAAIESAPSFEREKQIEKSFLQSKLDELKKENSELRKLNINCIGFIKNLVENGSENYFQRRRQAVH